jgi:hypothetical protein
MAISDRSDETTAAITLEWRGRIWHGEATGPMDRDHRQRLVGEAALDAVHRLFEPEVTLDLTGVAATDLGGMTMAVAQVELHPSGNRFAGSALVRDGSVEEATVRAVLDAMNRSIERTAPPNPD